MRKRTTRKKMRGGACPPDMSPNNCIKFNKNGNNPEYDLTNNKSLVTRTHDDRKKTAILPIPILNNNIKRVPEIPKGTLNKNIFGTRIPSKIGVQTTIKRRDPKPTLLIPNFNNNNNNKSFPQTQDGIKSRDPKQKLFISNLNNNIKSVPPIPAGFFNGKIIGKNKPIPFTIKRRQPAILKPTLNNINVKSIPSSMPEKTPKNNSKINKYNNYR